MSDCSIKLEFGKCYIGRNGLKYGPLVLSGLNHYPFLDNRSNKTWAADGVYERGRIDKLDLVREHVEQPAVADPVNNPSHYASGAVECIDAIQASMSVEAFRGYCKGTIEAYVWRYESKGGVEDLRKAEWYLKRLLATFDADA